MLKINYRNQQIDMLRGIAILAVLILHFHISYHLDQSSLNRIFSESFIRSVASNGNYGVTIFFVISGFLITSTSLERYGRLEGIDVIGFYIFRFSRIMPCLILVLSLIALFNFLHIPIFYNDLNSTSLTLAIFSVLTFWHNVLMEKLGYFNYCLNIFWSLSVEEIFYLAFPILSLFLKKTRFILIFWVVLIVIAPIYRSYYTNNEIIALYGYLSCFDAIAIGCIAAVMTNTIQFRQKIRNIVYYVAIFLMISVYLYNGIMENIVIGVSIMAIGTALFLLSVSNDSIHQKNKRNIFLSMICWLGKNSYELYLFHIIVLALMKEIIDPSRLTNFNKLIWMILFLTLSALTAGLISTFYSQPTNKKLRIFLANLRQKNSVFLTQPLKNGS